MADPCFPGSDAPYQLSYFTSSVSAILTILITTGNFLIIFAIAKDPLKKLRNPFAFFLANAAASDLMVGVVAMPVSTVFHYMEAKRSINKTLVYILHLTYFVSASASLFSMAAMTIDRFYALKSLSSKRRKLTRRNCILISVLTWVLAIGLSVFYFILGYISLLMVLIHISLVTTFAITFITYVKIIRRMRQIKQAFKQSNPQHLVNGEATSNQQNATSKPDRHFLRERKVTKVFLSLLITFLCINIPAMAFLYFLEFCLSCPCDTRHVFRDLVLCLISTASATNPVICLLRLPVMRATVFTLLKCGRRLPLNDSSIQSGDQRRAMQLEGVPKI
ncbi:5-hydroxytryptamine receptor 2A-like [Rhopilema esculentum]|uniref:5-hydroxytryptamine receptor 2A-like n=1 Tax=Rhopilema esculentum TaxID=499914 RepID=UPI0031D102F6|eukprot:gene17140-8672_t